MASDAADPDVVDASRFDDPDYVTLIEAPALSEEEYEQIAVMPAEDESTDGITDDVTDSVTYMTDSVADSAINDAAEAASDDTTESSADGTTINSITVSWITSDDEEDGDDSRLTLVKTSNGEFSVKIQVSFALSGQYNYEAGDITITIPKSIFTNRDGTSAGTVTLSVPEAPDESATFNYVEYDDYYVLTNVKTLSAASNIMFEISIDDLIPSELIGNGESAGLCETQVDGGTCYYVDVDGDGVYTDGTDILVYISDAFYAVIEVITNKDNLISLTSNTIDAVIDTSETIGNADLKSNGLSASEPSGWDESLFEVLDEDEDYVYIEWYSWVSVTGSQEYSMEVTSDAGGAITITYEDGTTETLTDTGAVILGMYSTYTGLVCNTQTDEDGDLTDTMTLILTEDDYLSSGKTGYYVYTYVAVPKSVLEDGAAYTITEEVTYTLTSLDDGTVTASSDSAQVEYAPETNEGGAGIVSVKKTGGYSYSSALDTLRSGDDDDSVTLKYKVTSTGTGGSTAGEDGQTVAVPFVMYTDDGDQLYFNYSSTTLTSDDYEFASLQVEKPSVYIWQQFDEAGYGYAYSADGTSLSYGIINGGSWGYAAVTDSALIPDVEVYGSADGGVTWTLYATVSWKSGSAVTTVAEGSGASASGTTITFPGGVTNIRSAVSNVDADGNAAAGVIVCSCYPVVRMFSSAAVQSVTEALFENSDAPETVLRNVAVLSVYELEVSAEDDVTTTIGDLIGTAQAAATDSLMGSSLSVTMEKTLDYVNDTSAQEVDLTYSITVYEHSNLTTPAEYYEAIEAGAFEEETSGVFYDLLPEGVVVDTGSIQMNGGGDVVTDVQLIYDFEGSGRTMMIVTVSLTPSPAYTARSVSGTPYNGYCDSFTLTFEATYSWNSLSEYGADLNNVAAFESGSDTLGTIEGFSGVTADYDEETGVDSGTNNAASSAILDVETYMTDGLSALSGREDALYVYANCRTAIDVVTTGSTGISKQVSANNSGVYSSGLETDGDFVNVYDNGYYTYRIMLTNDNVTQTKDIVIYDVIEAFTPTQQHGDDADDHGDVQWYGTLLSVDTSALKELGIEAKVYYTTLDADALNLYEDETDETGAATTTMGSDCDLSATYTDGSGNTAAVWNLLTDDTDLSAVTAIAVDCSTSTDGEAFILGAGESLCFYINMQAPDAQEVADTYNEENGLSEGDDGYAAAADIYDVDLDDETETEAGLSGGAHAYNNVSFVSSVASEDSTGATVWADPSLVHKEYTKVGLMPFEISVSKTFDDADDQDGIRPDEVYIVLLADGEAVSPDTADDSVTEITVGEGVDAVTYTAVKLSDLNEWTYTFDSVSYLNASGDIISYSFAEYIYVSDTDADGNVLSTGSYVSAEDYGYTPGVTWTISQEEDTCAYVYEITNVHVPETVDITGTKTWDDDSDAAGARPDSIRVSLYADGVLLKTLTVSADDSGTWSYAFYDLDKYALETTTDEEGNEIVTGGHEIVYEVRETQYYDGYYAVYDEDSNDITNVYYPYGNLKISKSVTDTTSEEDDVTFTFEVVICDADGAPDAGVYDYVIYNEAGDAEKSGTLRTGDHVEITASQYVIIYDIPSEYTYSVSEISVPSGFRLTGSSGTDGSIYANTTSEASFTNTYSASGKAYLTAVKTLSGRTLTAKQFRFAVLDEEGNTIRSATNAADGTVSFGAITYTQEDAGETYTYYIVETSENDLNEDGNGYTCDDARWTVSVSVTDNGDGTLTIETAYSDADGSSAQAASFENKYTAEGEIALVAWKTLEGRDLEAGEFSFVLTDADGTVVAKGTNTANGVITFSTLTFDQTDAGKTFTYYAKEIIPDEDDENYDATVVYDETVFAYQVTVADNGDGTLSFDYETLEASVGEDGTTYNASEESATPVFANTLEDGSLTIRKTVSADSEDDGTTTQFTFRVVLTGTDLPETLSYTLSSVSDSDASADASSETDTESETGTGDGTVTDGDTATAPESTTTQAAKAALTSYFLTSYGSTATDTAAGEEVSSEEASAAAAGEAASSSDASGSEAGSAAQEAASDEEEAAGAGIQDDAITETQTASVSSAAAASSADTSEVTASGTSGSVSWTLYADGTLFFAPVSGSTGTLGTYSYYSYVPWYSYASQILKIGTADGSTIRAGSSLAYFFYECTALTDISGLSDWDVSNVTSMYMTFYKCSAMTSFTGLENWDTSKVTTMEMTFYRCYALQNAGGLENWDTGAVTTFRAAFEECTSLTSVSALLNWDTSSAVSLERMFRLCSALASLDGLQNWDTSKNTTLYMTFYTYGSSFTNTDALADWDTSKVTTMEMAFYRCYALTSVNGLANWDTGAVTTFRAAFEECTALTSVSALLNWDTSSAVSLERMFRLCTALVTADLSGWTSSKLTTVYQMFYNCSSLTTLDLSGLNTGGCSSSTMAGIFGGTSSLQTVTLGADWYWHGATLPEAAAKYAAGNYQVTDENGYTWSYTGKWIREDETYGPYTAAEIVSNWNTSYAGTWIWQEVGSTYTVSFDANTNGEAYSGSVSACTYNIHDGGTLPKATYYRLGYTFTGWNTAADGSGTSYADEYEIEAGSSHALVSAADLQAGNTSITLYAQWTKIDTTITPDEDGTFELTLCAGEQATINLPAGTGYLVYEEDAGGGWVLVESAGTSGQISAGEESVSSFVNTYSEDIQPQTSAQITASKTLDGSAASAGAFEFTLTAVSGTVTSADESGDGTQVSLDASGIPMPDGAQEDEDGTPSVTVSNTAGGNIVFGTISYTQAGTYVYSLAEAAGDDDTITYDSTGYTVVVTVTENEDGSLSSSVAYYKEAESLLEKILSGLVGEEICSVSRVTFENTTKPGYLKITKTVTGTSLTDQVFTVQVSFNSGLTTQTVTLSSENNWTWTSDELEAGTTYSITETDLPDGYTLVSVSDSSEGTIRAGATSEVTVTNSYASSGGFNLAAVKTLTGRTLRAGEFTFRVTDTTQGSDTYNQFVATAVNDQNGDIVFELISVDAAGTYTYTITEEAGSDSDIDYDTTVYHVTVAATDNGDGSLDFKITYTDADSTEVMTTASDGLTTAPVFANTLRTGDLQISKTVINGTSQSVGQEFTFTVTLTDDAGAAVTGEYSYEVYASDDETHSNVLETGTITIDDEDGADLSLSDGETAVITGIPAGTAYTVTEEAAAYYTADQTSAAGTIDDEEAQSVSFINTYSDPQAATVTISAQKELTGREMTSGEFTFVLLEADADGTVISEDPVLEAQNGQAEDTQTDEADEVVSTAEVVFSALTYTQEGTYYYILKESVPDDAQEDEDTGAYTSNGVTYDTTQIMVVVDVKDDGEGSLQATVTYYCRSTESDTFDETTDSIVFTNTYQPAEVSVQLTARKTLTGRDMAAGDFTFVLTQTEEDFEIQAADGITLEAQNAPAEDGTADTVVFSTITYDTEGTYYYTIAEEIPSGASYDESTGRYTYGGVTYDNTTVHVTVTVIDQGSGSLEAQITYKVPSADGVSYTALTDDDIPSFENIYTVDPAEDNLTVIKQTGSGYIVSGGEFTFTLTDALTGEEVGTASNTAGGTVYFDTLTFTEAGTYVYTLTEDYTGVEGISYDGTVYTITYVVTDDGAGSLVFTRTITSTDDGETDTIVFTNPYNPEEITVSISGIKIIDDAYEALGRLPQDGEFVFSLTEVDENGTAVDGGITMLTTNTGSGFVFEDVATFTEPGVKYFLISEAAGTDDTLTYSTQSYIVRVTVTGEEVLSAQQEIVETDETNDSGTDETDDSGTDETDDSDTDGDSQDNAAAADDAVVSDDAGASGAARQADVSDNAAGDDVQSGSAGSDDTAAADDTAGAGDAQTDVAAGEDDASGSDGSDASGSDASGSGASGSAASDSNASGSGSSGSGDDVQSDAAQTEDVQSEAVQSDDVVSDAAQNADSADESQIAAGGLVRDMSARMAAGGLTALTPKARAYAALLSGIRISAVISLDVTDLTDDTDDTEGDEEEDAENEYTNLAVQYSQDASDLIFTNIYTPAAAKATISGTKTLTGRTLQAGEFTFVLQDADGNEVDTAVNAADGTFAFDELEYQKTGTYVYTVFEQSGEASGVTYDDMVYTVRVTVAEDTDDADGDGKVHELIAEVAYETSDGDADGMTFENTYTLSPVSVTLNVRKILDGADLAQGQFAFELRDADGTLLDTVVNDADGLAAFKAIVYEGEGTFVYTISETNDGQDNITYDNTVYTVAVTVWDDGVGALRAAVVYGENAQAAAAVFTNTYTEPPEDEDEDGGDTPEDEDEDGDTPEEDDEDTSKDEDDDTPEDEDGDTPEEDDDEDSDTPEEDDDEDSDTPEDEEDDDGDTAGDEDEDTPGTTTSTQTGDSVYLMFWMLLLCAAVCCAAVLVRRGTRRR